MSKGRDRRKRKKQKDKRRRTAKRQHRAAGALSPVQEQHQAADAHAVQVQLNDLAERLSKYDPMDLLASIGGMQLMPENAERDLRLKAYAHIVARSRVRTGRAPLSYRDLCAVLREDSAGAMLGHLEDPVEHLFAHEFVFSGGSHIVLPGSMPAAPFILGTICMGLFFRRPAFPNSEFSTWARRFIKAMLLLSDHVARRAGLRRGMPPQPVPDRLIAVPDESRLKTLKGSVRFTEHELDALFQPWGLSEDIIPPVTLLLGDTSLSSANIAESPLCLKPFVRAGNEYVCVAPAEILPATIRELTRVAINTGLRDAFCEAYSDAVLHSVVQSLGFLGHESVLPQPQLPALTIPHARQSVFTLDTDKYLYVVLLVDGLENMDPAKVNDTFDMAGMIAQVDDRMPAAVNAILGANPKVNDLLCLMVTEGFGREGFGGLTKKGWEKTPHLAISAEELSFVAYDRRRHPLELWDFALAWEALQDSATVLHTSTVGGFEFYLTHEHSFYASDESPRPNLVWFPPGGGGELRRRVLKDRDLHAAPGYLAGTFVEVTSVYSGSDVPIYCPMTDVGRRVSLIVEGLSLPIWVLGPDFTVSSDRARYYAYIQHVDAIAYWLWQFTPLLRPALSALTPAHEMIRIHIELSSDNDGNNNVGTEDVPVTATADARACDLRVTIRPALQDTLTGPDNAGERRLMQTVLVGLRDLLPAGHRDLLSDEAIKQGAEAHAPLGPKKKLFSVNGYENPQLTPVRVPYCQLSEAAESRVTDEIGTYVTVVLKLSVGKLGDSDEQVRIINDVVRWLFGRLQSMISTLDSHGLLEWLIDHREAIVHEGAENTLKVTTSRACFGDAEWTPEKLGKRLMEVEKVRMANRLLIEYVAAQPPGGNRRISLAFYNDLLAVASAITSWGNLSDLHHYEIADMEFRVLPSGRLGRSKEAYELPCSQFLEAYAFGQAQRASVSFGRHWRSLRDEGVGDISGFSLENAAAQAEWGLPVVEILQLLLTTIHLSLKEGTGVTVRREDEVIADFVRELSWPESKVRQCLGMLVLEPREDFMKPPAPYRKEDVYPWRLDRPMSYVRRPFVRRPRKGYCELLWGFRHMDEVGRYLSGYVASGRMRGSSKEVIALNTAINEVRGKDFNDAVGKVLKSDASLLVKERVKKVEGLRPPGDIDVLVADPARRWIVVIECKDLEAARTPYELHTELLKIFGGSDKGKSLVDKHLTRVTWVKQNLSHVIAFLGADPSGEWAVIEAIVTDSEMLSPYVKRCPALMVPFEQLKSRGLGCLDPE